VFVIRNWQSHEKGAEQTLWAKLFVRHPVLIADRPTARYRQHEASTSAQAARKTTRGKTSPEARFLEWFVPTMPEPALPILIWSGRRIARLRLIVTGAAARTAR
jgi:hypothetical protein